MIYLVDSSFGNLFKLLGQPRAIQHARCGIVSGKKEALEEKKRERAEMNAKQTSLTKPTKRDAARVLFKPLQNLASAVGQVHVDRVHVQLSTEALPVVPDCKEAQDLLVVQQELLQRHVRVELAHSCFHELFHGRHLGPTRHGGVGSAVEWPEKKGESPTQRQ